MSSRSQAACSGLRLLSFPSQQTSSQVSASRKVCRAFRSSESISSTVSHADFSAKLSKPSNSLTPPAALPFYFPPSSLLVISFARLVLFVRHLLLLVMVLQQLFTFTQIRLHLVLICGWDCPRTRHCSKCSLVAYPLRLTSHDDYRCQSPKFR